jgi:phosphatidylglycerol:prolipoprotein diacylglycerol transferase
MIPYIQIPELPIYGKLAIQPFGVLVVIAILTGQWLTRRRAKEAGVPDDEIVSALMWALGGGFIGAHLIEIFFYHPEKLLDEGPLVLLKIWDGLSSMGGFIGALVGLMIFFGRQKKPWLLHAELIIQGLALGWIFGRMGCSVVHDHPGRHSDFFLAVRYPDGPRHDLGFYEMLYVALVIFPATLILHRLKAPRGAYAAAVLILYSPVRFFFDFLRTEGDVGSDPRYLGLTMAQYTGVALLLAGFYFTWVAWKNRRADAAIETGADNVIALQARKAQPADPTPQRSKRRRKKGNK